MNARLSSLTERKALLRARAELDRTRLSFAFTEIRAVISPARDGARIAAIRPFASAIIAILAPIFGANKVARGLRYVSFAMTAYRVVRNWRRTD